MKWSSLGKLKHAEAGLSIAALAVMTALPLAEMVLPKLAGTGIPGSIPMVQHLTLWVTLLGAALAAGSDRLLALSTTIFFGERWSSKIRILTAALGAGICASLAAASVAQHSNHGNARRRFNLVIAHLGRTTGLPGRA